MRHEKTSTLWLVAIIALAFSSCARREPTGDPINPANIYQIGSLSVSGLQQASAIVRKNREMRLTYDGGETWQVIPPAAVVEAFECATMIDGQRGWALNRQGQVFNTDSGGATWTKISGLHEFTCASQIRFVNEKEGWILECLSLWRTRDGGTTWQEMLSTLTPGVRGQPTGMFAVDGETLIASGSGGQVYLTKDGGETWRIQAPLAEDKVNFTDVWFVDPLHGWLTGTQVVPGESLRPLLFETTDGGNSWQQIVVNNDILPSSVCFVGDEGWLAGSRRIVNGTSVKLEGELLHTTDGGRNWERVQLGPNEPFLIEVRFADLERGWVVGRDTLYRTDDAGKNWRRVLSLPPPASH